MSSKTKFVLLLAVFLVPTMASFIVFYFFPPNKTSNYGQLLQPIVTLPIAEAKLTDGRAVEPRAIRGKWLLLTRDSGRCESPCQTKLYAMRQARLVLGREMDRVVRVVLVDDDAMPSASHQQEFEGTLWVKASSWLTLLPAAPLGNHRTEIFGVDPLGNVFIRYGENPDIRALSNDFKKVLKASQIG